jgi:hypothetical protein
VPRKKASMMGYYNSDENDEEARMWCNKNGIRIYPKPTIRGTPTKWWLIIEVSQRVNQSPEEYPRNKVWQKMYEYYNYYYNKYKT